MNMIEKVEEAIADVIRNNENASTMWIEAAKAAILAMREPSEGMLEPVTNADGFFKVSDPKQSWQIMIDAALKEE